MISADILNEGLRALAEMKRIDPRWARLLDDPKYAPLTDLMDSGQHIGALERDYVDVIIEPLMVLAVYESWQRPPIAD